MNLKDFVKNVLTDVTEAIQDTCTASNRGMHLNVKEGGGVQFDIAVTVEELDSAKGGAGIKVLSIIDGGGEISKESRNSVVSRVQFSVYVDRWSDVENREREAVASRLIGEDS